MSKVAEAVQAGRGEIDLELGAARYRLIRIPPGELDLGSPPGEPGRAKHEGPARRVRITRPFYIGKFEVTQAVFEGVMGTPPPVTRGADIAVDQLTYVTALELCGAASRLSGVTVTLPTEAQWEHACRAGTRGPHHGESSPQALDRIAWTRENSGGRPHAVGEKEPNSFGLHDMLGNVWEPCLDFLPDYATIAVRDPVGRCSLREGAMRGGGWMHPREYARAAARLWTNDMFGGLGLRLVVNT